MADTAINRYLSLAYTIVLKRDEEGDVVATFAELDGCVAHGSNEAEALQNLREAQEAWLAAALDAGLDIPVPEIEEDLPSGKFVLRLPRSLHQKLIKLAKKDDVSLNQLAVMAMTEHVARREGRVETRAHFASAWKRPPIWTKAPGEVRQGGEYLEVMKEKSVIQADADSHQHLRSSPARVKRG